MMNRVQKYVCRTAGLTMTMRCCKVLLSVLLSFGFLFCNGQAKLLNPYSVGKVKFNGKDVDVYIGNNNKDFKYLKAKISYLCPVPSKPGDENGNSKRMRSLQRISKSAGEAYINSHPDARKTCFSVSYNKDWVEGASENYIDPSYPDIVYAFSTGNETDGYDVYYWVSDDLSPTPTNNDDAIRPLLSGNATQLFQQGKANGYRSYLETLDLSGWDFKEVENMTSFLAGNIKLTNVTFGTTVDLYNVTSISSMFDECNVLSKAEFTDLVSTFVIDDSKLTDRNAKASKYKNEVVTTANGIKYLISNSGAFDKKTDGITTMTIRNLDASLDKTTINFCWDIVFENESVQSYTVECIDATDTWEHKVDLLSEDDCYLVKDNVKLYRGSYVITNKEDYKDKIKKFRLRISYTNGTTGYSDPFDLFCDGEILPIVLSDYTLTSSDNLLTLSWTTESETNNDYFTIYVSNDGINFDVLTNIYGSGTTSTSHLYSYSFPKEDIKYVMLSQTDFDGTSKSFEIKSVSNSTNGFRTLKYGNLIFRINNNSLEYHYRDNF